MASERIARARMATHDTGGRDRLRELVAEELQRMLGPGFGAQNENAPDREVMNADDVAVFLGVDRKTVYDYANRGEIPHQRLGKRLLFSRAALMSWLRACKTAPYRKGQ